jgi:hypothetical protein
MLGRSVCARPPRGPSSTGLLFRFIRVRMPEITGRAFVQVSLWAAAYENLGRPPFVTGAATGSTDSSRHSINVAFAVCSPILKGMSGTPNARIFLKDDRYGFEVWYEGCSVHFRVHCFATLDECLADFDMRNERVWEFAPENPDGMVLTSHAYKVDTVPWRLEQERGSFRGRRSKR